MTPATIATLLTLLAAGVVVTTRVRLAGEKNGTARASVGPIVGNLHTLAGLVAASLWVLMLYTGDNSWGWLSMPLWWVTTLAGLLILVRWLPVKGGRHSGPSHETWGEGPGLAILAHGGVLVTVLLFTVYLAFGVLPA